MLLSDSLGPAAIAGPDVGACTLCRWLAGNGWGSGARFAEWCRMFGTVERIVAAGMIGQSDAESAETGVLGWLSYRRLMVFGEVRQDCLGWAIRLRNHFSRFHRRSVGPA